MFVSTTVYTQPIGEFIHLGEISVPGILMKTASRCHRCIITSSILNVLSGDRYILLPQPTIDTCRIICPLLLKCLTITGEYYYCEQIAGC